jgi:DNA-binding IclR family transcriptional regulator
VQKLDSSRGVAEAGVALVAVAVRGSHRVPAAAISVAGPVSRMTGPAIEKITAELREHAAELEGPI